MKLRLSSLQIYTLFALIIVVKMVIIPFTSESFDTATYLYQVKKLLDFDFTLLDNWNKSYFLLFIYKAAYSAYVTFLELFHLKKDNLILFHIFFKVPFILSDLGMGLLLYKIAAIYKISQKYRLIIILLWLLNPWVWFSVYMKGQYEIMVALLLIASLYLALLRKALSSIILLAFAFAFKYVFIILLPLYIIYLYNSKYADQKISLLKNMASFSIFSFKKLLLFLLIYLLNILPFIKWESVEATKAMLGMHYATVFGFVGSTNSNIQLNLPASDGPIYKIFYYLIYGKEPFISTPLYEIWQNFFSIYFFSFAMVFVSIILFVKYVIMSRHFSKVELLYYLALILGIFYLTQSRVEGHWYLWITPLLLLLIFLHNIRALYVFILSICIHVVAAMFGAGPQLLHFANLNMEYNRLVSQWANTNFNFDTHIYLFSAILIAIVYILVLTRKRNNHLFSEAEKKLCLMISLGLNTAFFVIIFIFFSTSAFRIFKQRNGQNIPSRSISSAVTWYYSFAYDVDKGETFFPKAASTYLLYVFKEYDQVFKENFLLALDKKSIEENINKLPKASAVRNGIYFFEFSSIQHLLNHRDGLIFLELNEAQNAKLVHSFLGGYDESYIYYKKSVENPTYSPPYYLMKFKNDVLFSSIVFYVLSVGSAVIIFYNYHRILVNLHKSYEK